MGAEEILHPWLEVTVTLCDADVHEADMVIPAAFNVSCTELIESDICCWYADTDELQIPTKGETDELEVLDVLDVICAVTVTVHFIDWHEVPAWAAEQDELYA